MPRALPLLSSFSSGELGPRVAARVDLERYPNGCEEALNLLLFPQGGWTRRPGTTYICETKDNKRPTLLPFADLVENATMLLLTPFRMRFVRGLTQTTVPATSAALTNGDFSSGGAGWTDLSSGGAFVSYTTGDQDVPRTEGTAIGDMTQNGGLAAAFDGNTSQNRSACAAKTWQFGWVGKTWSEAKTLAGFRCYASKDEGFKNGQNPTLRVLFQGSDDPTFTTGVATLADLSVPDAKERIVSVTSDIDRSTAYLNHRVRISGGDSDKQLCIAEVEFIEAGVGTGYAELHGEEDGIAHLEQLVTGLTPGSPHVVGFRVRGAEVDRFDAIVGTESGKDDLASNSRGVGWHSVGFTPEGTSAYIGFRHNTVQTISVDEVRLYSNEPLEINTPWGEVDLDNIRSAQAGSTMFVVSGADQVHHIERYGDFSWSIARTSFPDGPWLDADNPDEVRFTLASADQDVTTTMTASADYFEAGHQGGFFRIIEPSGKLSHEPWASAKGGWAVGDTCVNEGNVYRAVTVSDNPSGNIPPTHETGDARDHKESNKGIVWRYVNKGYGVVRVSSYIGPTEVRVRVISACPGKAVTEGTTQWQESVYSPLRGWPSVVGFFEKRLLLADNPANPGTLYASVTDDFSNFRLGDEDDDSITIVMRSNDPGRGDVNRVLWLDSGDRLIAGTTGGPWIIRSSTRDEPLTPTNVGARRQVHAGCANIAPISAFDVALYLGRDRRSLEELFYSVDRDRYIVNDTTILAEHILGTNGARQLTYAEDPIPLILARRDDGLVAQMIYEPTQEVLGWARWQFGGSFEGSNAVVESIGVLPGTLTAGTEDRDVIYVAMKRTIGGTTKRYIEYMNRTLREGDDSRLQVHLDSALSYDGVDATTFTGLEHLEGQTVGVWADGLTHPDRTVASGSITLERPAAKVVVGLKYTHRYKSLKLAYGAAAGTAHGQKKKINQIGLALLRSRGGTYGNGTVSYPIEYPGFALEQDEIYVPFTGELAMPFPGAWARDPRIVIESDTPEPFSLLAIIPRMDTSA